MKYIILKITTTLATIIGLVNVIPKPKHKQIMFQKEGKNLFFVMDTRYLEPKTQIKNNQKIIMKNNEAIVFWKGGPVFSSSWNNISKNYGFMFGKNQNSEDTKGKIVKGNFRVPFDVYAGTQVQWAGAYLEDYFGKEINASNLRGFENPNSQRAVTISDTKYFNDLNNLKKAKKAVNQMMVEQVEVMMRLAKKLKKNGYKKVHYIGHSFGTILLHEMIKQKGDDAFRYVDSITSVSTKFKATTKQINDIDGKTLPYFIYDEKTKSYTKPLKVKVQNNAITRGVMLSVFEVLVKRDYTKDLIKLSNENKEKYQAVWTKYDWRLGSMSQEETDLANHGIKILEVSTQELISYDKTYLAQENYIKSTPTHPRQSLTDNGVNHHDLLLRWYLDNTLSKYKIKTWMTKETSFRDSRSYWCNIPTEQKFVCDISNK